MANIAIFRINYKSDFILTLNSDAGWMTPFCIKFWTGAPSQAYFVGFDGTTYTHCAPVDGEPTKLLVQFDDHHLPIGDLKFQIAYHFTVADFPASVEDEVINQASVIIEQDGEPAQVMLDFNGETAPEIEFSLPAYANEAQRIANEQQRIADEQQRIDNEAQRIQNEETRINQEQTRQDNEAQRIRNEQTRINQEEARVREFATLKHDAQEATTAANDAAALANQKAQLAADKALLAADKSALAQDAASLANEKAQLAADKAALANDAAALANEKAALAQQKAEYAKDQGDYAKEQGDYAKRKGDDAAAQMQQQAQAFSEAQAARQTAYEQAEGTESGSEAGDGSRWGAFKTNEAARDAKVDAKVADITNLQKAVAEGAVYDISANHLTEGVPTKYANLSAALGVDGVNVPVDKRKGGMSIKFVQSSDNKYVQARCMAQNFTIDITQWQRVDATPTYNSKNLVESGGVAGAVGQIKVEIGFSETITLTTDDEVALGITGTVVSAPASQSWCGLVIPLINGATYDFGTPFDSSTQKGWQTIGILNKYPEIGDTISTFLNSTTARLFIPSDSQKYALIYLRVGSLPYDYLYKSDGMAKDITDLQGAVSSLSTELNKYGLTIGGIVKSTDSPTDNSGKQVYLCTEKGIYANFNSSDVIPANGLYYWVFSNNNWYKRVIVSHQKCKHEKISLIIREMFVVGAKPSDQLYIVSGGSNVENQGVNILVHKNGQTVSQYWHGSDAKFNEVVEFTEMNNSGIKIYAIFDEYTVTQTSGLAYSNSGLMDECYSLDTNGEIAAYLYKDNADKIKEITPKDGTVKWTINNDINACVAEMYIPNAESLFDDGLYVSRCVVSDAAIRFDLRGFTSDTWIVTCDIDLHKYYFNNQSDGSYRTYFGQGAITPIYKTVDGILQRIGYIKFNLHNFATSGTRIQVDLNAITNIDNSPSIKKMLADDRQIILLGDSHFGYPTPNILADVIQGISGIRTFNLGFGGCRMAWRTSDGSNDYDVYTFPEIADAIVSQNFVKQRDKIGIGFGYARQVADLEAIDITKPMQIVLEYGNNDSNNFVDPTPIGSIWQDDASFDITVPSNVTAKLASLSRNTFLGAFNYGLLKLYNAFPVTLNLQVMSQMWRFLNDSNNQRVSAPNYRNGLNLSLSDYNDALKNDCIQLGIRYNDFFNAGIMNYFSLRQVSQQDDNIGIGIGGSAHLEEVGFAMLAQYLVDKIRNFYSI